jgi:hypothetical protein
MTESTQIQLDDLATIDEKELLMTEKLLLMKVVGVLFVLICTRCSCQPPSTVNDDQKHRLLGELKLQQYLTEVFQEEGCKGHALCILP